MKVGSLFSGIGGLELGLEMGLGDVETLWQVEYEEHGRLILAEHWPDAQRHEDVRHVGAANLEPVDLICGGFPCQPHSVAGKRQASRDERDLWGEFARIVGELRPRWVVAENVRGLLSSSDPAFSRDHPGGFFGRVLRDLADLGFDAEWHCYPASSVGAHHIRERVFIVAHAQRLRRPAAAQQGRHAEPAGAGQDNQPRHADHRAAHLADTGRRRGQDDRLCTGRAQSGSRSASHLADADLQGSQGRSGLGESTQRRSVAPSERHDLARHGKGAFPDWRGPHPHPLTERGLEGEVERDVRGVAHGISLRVDRLARLGNSVAPAQAAVIGRAIKEAEAHLARFGVMPEQIVRPCHFRTTP